MKEYRMDNRKKYHQLASSDILYLVDESIDIGDVVALTLFINDVCIDCKMYYCERFVTLCVDFDRLCLLKEIL